jgi:hypothetical protein
MKDVQVTKKASALKREHPALQNKKFLNFFLLLRVIFALLDPDPDSGSTDLIESGSEILIITLHHSQPICSTVRMLTLLQPFFPSCFNIFFGITFNTVVTVRTYNVSAPDSINPDPDPGIIQMLRVRIGRLYADVGKGGLRYFQPVLRNWNRNFLP